MQVNVCLNKEQIGTLFVQVGAPEGGFREGGGGEGGPPQKVYMPSKKNSLLGATSNNLLRNFTKPHFCVQALCVHAIQPSTLEKVSLVTFIITSDCIVSKTVQG